jgi:SAM-dependent methyltransferase
VRGGLDTHRSGDLSVEAQARYDAIRELLVARTPPGGSVVELGAAPGDQAADLSVRGFAVTAVDIGISSDEWATGEAGRMQKLFDETGVRFVEWDLEKTPYPLEDRSFDAVVMTEVYEHLRDYPIHSLEESFRILRPGGHLYFTTPNAAGITNRVRLLLGHSTQTPLADWIGGLPFARHAREYTVGEIRHLLETVGFTVELLAGRHFFIGSGRTGVVPTVAKVAIDRISRVRPTLAPCLVAVARRP